MQDVHEKIWSVYCACGPCITLLFPNFIDSKVELVSWLLIDKETLNISHISTNAEKE